MVLTTKLEKSDFKAAKMITFTIKKGSRNGSIRTGTDPSLTSLPMMDGPQEIPENPHHITIENQVQQKEHTWFHEEFTPKILQPPNF